MKMKEAIGSHLWDRALGRGEFVCLRCGIHLEINEDDAFTLWDNGIIILLWISGDALGNMEAMERYGCRYRVMEGAIG